MADNEKKKEESAAKKWSEMTPAEKLKAMPEYKKTVQTKIDELKKKLSAERRKLKALDNEEKALKYEVIAEKAKADGKKIEDLM